MATKLFSLKPNPNITSKGEKIFKIGKGVCPSCNDTGIAWTRHWPYPDAICRCKGGVCWNVDKRIKPTS